MFEAEISRQKVNSRHNRQRMLPARSDALKMLPNVPLRKKSAILSVRFKFYF